MRHIHDGELERPLSSPVQLTRNGKTVTVSRGFFQNGWTITQDGNKTTIHRGFLSNDWTITRNGSTITIDQGPLSNTTTINLYQHGALMQRAWHADVKAAETGNELRIDPGGLSPAIDVKSDGNVIHVNEGLSPEQTLTGS